MIKESKQFQDVLIQECDKKQRKYTQKIANDVTVSDVTANFINEAVVNIVDCFDDENNFTFSKIVENAESIMKQFTCRMIEQCLKIIDKQFDEGRDIKLVRVKHQKQSRHILTNIGEINIDRKMYFDTDSQKCFFYIDERFGISKYARLDERFESKLMLGATIGSFGAACRSVDNVVSKQTVHNIVKRYDIAENDKLTKALDSSLWTKRRYIETLYIEADEDHIHLQTGESAETKIIYVHEGKREISNRTHHSYAKDYSGNRATKADKRRSLINARYFCSTTSTAKEIWEEVYYYIENTYKPGFKLHISGDGASWIRSSLDIFYKAKFHLDKFHIYKSITSACGMNKPLSSQIVQALNEKDHRTVTALLQNYYTSKSKRSEKKRIVDTTFYLQNNFEYIDLLSPVSCGAEGHVSHVLSSRMSSRPMGWSLSGAERIARLRASLYNGADFSCIVPRENKHKKENKIENNDLPNKNDNMKSNTLKRNCPLDESFLPVESPFQASLPSIAAKETKETRRLRKITN